MTLKQIVNGSQPYKFVVIEDSVDEQANLLFRSFVNEGLTCGKEVHVLCYDNYPSEIERNLNLQKSAKLFFHDLISDSAGWLGDQCSQKNDICKIIFSSGNRTSSDCSGFLIIIDSLSSFIISDGFNRVYRQIHRLINDDVGKGEYVRQLVSIIYPETLLNYDSISVQLKHLATNWLTLMNKKVNQSDSCIVRIENRKANGKLLRQIEQCWLDSDSLLQSKKIEISKELVSKSDNNEIPSELTTFKLSLNEEEKVARSQLVLPYLKHENSTAAGGQGGGGSIYYEPDENDDWDEEDPDDDLDV